MEKRIVECEEKIEKDDYEMLDRFFSNYTGVDAKNPAPKFVNYIGPTREIMLRDAKIAVKYCVTDIIDRTGKGLVIENDQIFAGEQIKKAYISAEQIILFVSSVINIDDIIKAHPEMMEKYFIEYWAVAMLAVVREKLIKMLNKELAAYGKKLTSPWSPGQAQFRLENQKPLFEVLKPETIGVKLDKNMRMLPLKSVSGTLGIIPLEFEEELISCDFCEHARNCPAYKGKRWKNIS